MTTGAVITKNGFNLILDRAFNSSTSYTVPSRFGIGSGTTTPAVMDTGLETIITGWSGGTDYKNYVSGYPSFDTSNQKVIVQGFVSSTQAVGETITEYADFNTDGTPVCSSHIVFDAISKTNAVQVYFTTTYVRG